MGFALINKRFCQLTLVTLVYLLPSVQAMLPIDDPDVWWHLRTGEWVVRAGWVPTIDPFSSFGHQKPWIAYSWLFELILYGVHSVLGLQGIVFFTVILALLIALALHRLVRTAKLSFRSEIIITAMGLACMKSLMTPRPWLFSIVFLIIELNLLLEFRRSGAIRPLYWLPVLFFLWANVHVQFVYGLAVLFLVLVEPLIVRLVGSPGSTIPKVPELDRRLVIVFALATIATVATPYHLFTYRPVFDYATQTAVFQNIAELHPLFFRNPVDWIFLALMLTASCVLGWRRETGPFPYILLAMGALLSFRARRDVWVGAVAAVAIVSNRQAVRVAADHLEFTAARILAVVLSVAIALIGIARLRNITERELQAHVKKTFPADAVAFVRGRNFAPPLYNYLDWGGFLIWSLPEFKVSMDGRTNLQGEKRIEENLAVWAGHPGWASDAELSGAKLIIAEIGRPLTALLRGDTRFKLVYEDKTAAVFVAAADGKKHKS
ncbi:MAG: hypothetical protein ACM3TN_23855 [Alphaproteobacteria bacterium]